MISAMRFLLSVALCVPLLAQQPAEAPKPQRPPAPPKNLKIIQPSEVRATMQAFRVALGVQCTFCHVQGDMASDDNHHKEVARMMMTMTKEINEKFQDGKSHVTCYTCHRGAEHPLTAAPAGADAPKSDAPKPETPKTP
jgi:hypothetical protein